MEERDFRIEVFRGGETLVRVSCGCGWSADAAVEPGQSELSVRRALMAQHEPHPA